MDSSVLNTLHVPGTEPGPHGLLGVNWSSFRNGAKRPWRRRELNIHYRRPSYMSLVREARDIVNHVKAVDPTARDFVAHYDEKGGELIPIIW